VISLIKSIIQKASISSAKRGHLENLYNATKITNNNIKRNPQEKSSGDSGKENKSYKNNTRNTAESQKAGKVAAGSQLTKPEEGQKL
jgi:hypothetical protein